MSEKVNEAKVNETKETATAEVEGVQLEAKVENGKVVYEEKKPKKAGIGTAIKKGFIKLGMAVKHHPLATALIVTGVGAAGYGAKAAYDKGHDNGFAEGYTAHKTEVEAEEQRKLEEAQLQALEAENMEIPEVEPVVNELGEEVG